MRTMCWSRDSRLNRPDSARSWKLSSAAMLVLAGVAGVAIAIGGQVTAQERRPEWGVEAAASLRCPHDDDFVMQVLGHPFGQPTGVPEEEDNPASIGSISDVGGGADDPATALRRFLNYAGYGHLPADQFERAAARRGDVDHRAEEQLVYVTNGGRHASAYAEELHNGWYVRDLVVCDYLLSS